MRSITMPKVFFKPVMLSDLIIIKVFEFMFINTQRNKSWAYLKELFG